MGSRSAWHPREVYLLKLNSPTLGEVLRSVSTVIQVNLIFPVCIAAGHFFYRWAKQNGPSSDILLDVLTNNPAVFLFFAEIRWLLVLCRSHLNLYCWLGGPSLGTWSPTLWKVSGPDSGEETIAVFEAFCSFHQRRDVCKLSALCRSYAVTGALWAEAKQYSGYTWLAEYCIQFLAVYITFVKPAGIEFPWKNIEQLRRASKLIQQHCHSKMSIDFHAFSERWLDRWAVYKIFWGQKGSSSEPPRTPRPPPCLRACIRKR